MEALEVHGLQQFALGLNDVGQIHPPHDTLIHDLGALRTVHSAPALPCPKSSEDSPPQAKRAMSNPPADSSSQAEVGDTQPVPPWAYDNYPKKRAASQSASAPPAQTAHPKGLDESYSRSQGETSPLQKLPKKEIYGSGEHGLADPMSLSSDENNSFAGDGEEDEEQIIEDEEPDGVEANALELSPEICRFQLPKTPATAHRGKVQLGEATPGTGAPHNPFGKNQVTPVGWMGLSQVFKATQYTSPLTAALTSDPLLRPSPGVPSRRIGFPTINSSPPPAAISSDMVDLCQETNAITSSPPPSIHSETVGEYITLAESQKARRERTHEKQLLSSEGDNIYDNFSEDELNNQTPLKINYQRKRAKITHKATLQLPRVTAPARKAIGGKNADNTPLRKRSLVYGSSRRSAQRAIVFSDSAQSEFGEEEVQEPKPGGLEENMGLPQLLNQNSSLDRSTLENDRPLVNEAKDQGGKDINMEMQQDASASSRKNEGGSSLGHSKAQGEIQVPRSLIRPKAAQPKDFAAESNLSKLPPLQLDIVLASSTGPAELHEEKAPEIPDNQIECIAATQLSTVEDSQPLLPHPEAVDTQVRAFSEGFLTGKPIHNAADTQGSTLLPSSPLSKMKMRALSREDISSVPRPPEYSQERNSYFKEIDDNDEVILPGQNDAIQRPKISSPTNLKETSPKPVSNLPAQTPLPLKAIPNVNSNTTVPETSPAWDNGQTSPSKEGPPQRLSPAASPSIRSNPKMINAESRMVPNEILDSHPPTTPTRPSKCVRLSPASQRADSQPSPEFTLRTGQKRSRPRTLTEIGLEATPPGKGSSFSFDIPALLSQDDNDYQALVEGSSPIAPFKKRKKVSDAGVLQNKNPQTSKSNEMPLLAHEMLGEDELAIDIRKSVGFTPINRRRNPNLKGGELPKTASIELSTLSESTLGTDELAADTTKPPNTNLQKDNEKSPSEDDSAPKPGPSKIRKLKTSARLLPSGRTQKGRIFSAHSSKTPNTSPMKPQDLTLPNTTDSGVSSKVLTSERESEMEIHAQVASAVLDPSSALSPLAQEFILANPGLSQQGIAEYTKTIKASKIVAPQRVFALFKDGGSGFYPATCLSVDVSSATNCRIRFDDDTEDILNVNLVRKLELLPGDVVKLYVPHMRTKNFVVVGLKDKIAEPQTPSRRNHVQPGPQKNTVSDIRGFTKVILVPKLGDSKTSLQSNSDPIEMPLSDVYLTKMLIAQFKDRFYTDISPPEAPNLEHQNLDGKMSITSTPSSSLLNASRSNASLPASARQTPQLATKSGLFNNMVFAVSFVESEAHKKRVIKSISDQGGKLLTDGFDELFKIDDASKTTAAGGGATKSPGLRLTLQAEKLGFACLIADKHSRRAKYFQALALGLPCLSGRWIEDCTAKNEIISWEPYLLSSGESSYLDGAVRSRTLHAYPPSTALFAQTIEKRPRLLKGRSLIFIKGKGKVEELRRAYLFLTCALGVGSLAKVSNAEAAVKMLADPKSTWDTVYVGGQEKIGENISGGTSSGKKRKSLGEEGESALSTMQAAGIKLIRDEYIVQSLILGKLLDD
ncbi:MAG: hypothetical protein M1829_000248 [Trizodia sp. TS-e1964]|nr:MAG: hypothetical protein M1829_000248 [Trizodia sp. TS-e1964]